MNVKPVRRAPDPAAPPSAPLAALVLAAGRASRFGGAKLLAPWRGGALIDGALAAAFSSEADPVVLVVGAQGAEVAAAAWRWVDCANAAPRLRVVEATGWAKGLSASLRAGLAALGPEIAGTYIFLADMPRAPGSVLAPLAQALRAGAPAAVPMCAGVMGHPALIGAGLFPDIAQLTGDRGARAILERLGPAVARIETDDDGVLFDVDTPDALAQLQARA